jgi:LysM repeat protein
MKKVLLFIVLLSLLMPAASPRTHVVTASDTIAKIATLYQMSNFDVIKANKQAMEAPNYPIYVGQRLSVPGPLGTTKSVADHIANAPAADFRVYTSKKGFKIVTSGFARGSTWYVKYGGEKIGKFKTPKKSTSTFEIKYTGSLKPKVPICIKNATTNLFLCRPVIIQ